MSFSTFNWCTRDPGSKSDFYEEYPHQTESLRHLYENNNISSYRRDEDDNRNYNDNHNNDCKNNTNNNYHDDNNNNDNNDNDYPPHHSNDPDNYSNQEYNSYSSLSNNPQPQCLSQLSPHTQPSSTSMRHQHMHDFDLSRDNERDEQNNDVGIDDDDAFDRERYYANQLQNSETGYPPPPVNDHIPVRC